MQKTYKRECAVVMLLIVFGLTIAGMWYPAAATAAASLRVEVFTFAALAFGADAYSKQIAQ